MGDLIDVYERAYERLHEVSGEVINVGGGPSNTLSLLDLVAKLERSFGRRLDPAFAPWRPGDQRVFVADVRKAEALLGWRPHVSTDEGVDRLIRWIKENRGLFGPSQSGQTRFRAGSVPYLDKPLTPTQPPSGVALRA